MAEIIKDPMDLESELTDVWSVLMAMSDKIKKMEELILNIHRGREN